MSLKQTPLTCSGHTRPVVDLAFSDKTDFSYFLISASKDGKPMLRNGDTGDWIGTFEGHKGAVWGATLNPGATRAATGAADYSAKVWDSVSGACLHNFTHKHIVKSVHFAPSDNFLLTGSNEKLIRIFDLNQPEAEPELFKGHTGSITKALWLPGEQTIISIADDKTLRFWDRRTCEEIRKIDLNSSAADLELCRDGKMFTLTHGNTVSFRDIEKGDVIKQFDGPSRFNSASLHPEKSVFVCGGDDFKMYKYDFETGQELDSFKGHFGPVHTIRFSPDGELYASGSEDGTLRLWQTNVGTTYGLWKCVVPDEVTENNVGTTTVET